MTAERVGCACVCINECVRGCFCVCSCALLGASMDTWRIAQRPAVLRRCKRKMSPKQAAHIGKEGATAKGANGKETRVAQRPCCVGWEVAQ